MYYVTIKPVKEEKPGFVFFINQNFIHETNKEKGTFRLINNLLVDYYKSKDKVILPDFEVSYDNPSYNDAIDADFENPVPVREEGKQKKWRYKIMSKPKNLEGRVTIYSYGATPERRDKDVSFTSQDFSIFFNMLKVDSFEEKDAFVVYAKKYWRKLL